MPNEQEGNNKKEGAVSGVVIDALPNTMFKVKLDDGSEVLAYLAGKMRMHRIRVLVGDKVEMLLDEYGGKARIFKRS
ncbi:translation initiation factor IF-1 [Candidatus Nomurabacteria bacterium]|nr:translation initiation factor IF-1 [Candidatus Nomurabacteria bacterium]